MGKSSTGLKENVAALLCYSLFFLPGIIFFLLERSSRHVKFHALQATLSFIFLYSLGLIVNLVAPYVVSGLAALIASIVNMIVFALWFIGMVKAYQGEQFPFPVIGNLVKKYLDKTNFV